MTDWLKLKHGLYLIVALGLLIYALPRLVMGQGWTLETVFGIAWLSIMLLIVAAQLHELLGVNEQKRQEMNRVRLYKRRQLRQWVEKKAQSYSEGR